MNKTREYLHVAPLILTISPTHRCTSNCENCCFGCNPQIDYIMDYDTVTKYIDAALKDYPTIKVLVLTGGECFLLGKTLVRIVKYGHGKGLMSRVVTNAYWASSYKAAMNHLAPLVEAGLTEINFSTGDEHSKFVKKENIVNAVLAAHHFKLKTILISVESPPNATLTSSYFREHPSLVELFEKNQIECIDASWISFKEDKETFRFGLHSKNRRPCGNIFTGIFINPYSQMLACCGLTVEYNKFLKLGNLNQHSIKELYEKQFDDLFKVWLYTEGPLVIYEKVMKARNLTPRALSHECAYCMELIREPENIETIKNIIQKELPSMLFSYNISKTKFTVK